MSKQKQHLLVAGGCCAVLSGIFVFASTANKQKVEPTAPSHIEGKPVASTLTPTPAIPAPVVIAPSPPPQMDISTRTHSLPQRQESRSSISSQQTARRAQSVPQPPPDGGISKAAIIQEFSFAVERASTNEELQDLWWKIERVKQASSDQNTWALKNGDGSGAEIHIAFTYKLNQLQSSAKLKMQTDNALAGTQEQREAWAEHQRRLATDSEYSKRSAQEMYNAVMRNVQEDSRGFR